MATVNPIDVTGMTAREGISLFCIPTTSRNLKEASRLSGLGEAFIVADAKRFPGVEGAMTPVQMLDACPSGSVLRLPIISFTDQFVCTTNAPLVVAREGLYEYRSSFEVVCSERFRIPIRFARGRDWTAPHVVENRTAMIRALALMSEYFDACNKLGPDWLARKLQNERSMDYRLRLAVLLRRQYSSLVMAAAVESEMTPAHSRIIDVLFGQERHPLAAQAPR